MDEIEERGVQGQGARGRRKRRRLASAELRLKAVKLYLEEGLPSDLVCQELEVERKTLWKWAGLYRRLGEEGLRSRQPARSAPSASSERLRQKIVEVKRRQPSFGVKRISQWLKRVLFLKASPETVRQALHGNCLHAGITEQNLFLAGGGGIIPESRVDVRRQQPGQLRQLSEELFDQVPGAVLDVGGRKLPQATPVEAHGRAQLLAQ